MNFENANKKQLLQIALNENCPLEYKYEAARELQLKTWSSSFLLKLVRYWGMGLSEVEIAERFGVEVWEVKKQLQRYNLFGKRVRRGGLRL
jgi:hypothetical protein